MWLNNWWRILRKKIRSVKSKNEYSNHCLRGMNDWGWLDENQVITSQAFLIKKENPARSDNYLEESINWHDNTAALNHLFIQKKIDKKTNAEVFQFPVGVAQVPLSELKKIKKTPIFKDAFDYERHIIDGNDYHGNLLLRNGVTKNIRDLVSSALAVEAKYIPNPNVKRPEKNPK